LCAALSIRLLSCAGARLLSFCAQVAAGLPLKRADEPYALVVLINGVVSRRAAAVLAALEASLAAGKVEPPISEAALLHGQW
jgi:hypothetical protein